MTTFPNAEQICSVKAPLSWDEKKNQLFVDACREMALFHSQNSPELRRLYEKKGFRPETLRSVADLSRIPYVGVTAMKYHLLTSQPEDRAVLKLTSSGTSGQKTQVWFDQGSLDRVQRMLDGLLEEEGLTSARPTNYLLFNYDPREAGDLGTAYSQNNQLRFAPVKRVEYAIRKDEKGEWFFDKERTLRALDAFALEGGPVRFLGMPAFLHDFLSYLGERRYRLDPESLLIYSGGWKASEDKKTTKEEFRALCGEKLGLPASRVRDAYGLAEHSAPYYECEAHRFHVPVFNRLITRDPVTMEPTAPGERGVLELLTPFNAMMPTLAVLSTDWAVISEEPCPCGKNSPIFTILGRAGISKHKGCALHAEDILKKKAQT